jgi:hypothetical protein
VVFLGSTPIGGPIAGWVGEHLGTRIGLAGGGLIAVAAGLAVLPRIGSLKDTSVLLEDGDPASSASSVPA